MSDQSEPKTWWATLYEPEDVNVVGELLNSDGEFEVVEKAAYDALREEREQLRQAARPVIHERLLEANAKLTRAREALEKIVAYDRRLPDFSDDARTVTASEALKEIGE